VIIAIYIAGYVVTWLLTTWAVFNVFSLRAYKQELAELSTLSKDAQERKCCFYDVDTIEELAKEKTTTGNKHVDRQFGAWMSGALWPAAIAGFIIFGIVASIVFLCKKFGPNINLVDRQVTKSQKQRLALLEAELKIEELQKDLKSLKKEGLVTEEEIKNIVRSYRDSSKSS
jgi:hypothetical protein